MGSNKLALMCSLLSFVQICAVVIASVPDPSRPGVSTEAVEEFCASVASATPYDHVDACIENHLSLSQLNHGSGGKHDPRDFILEGLNAARSVLASTSDFLEKEVVPRTNKEKRPLVFHVVKMSLSNLDMALEFFRKADALSTPGPIPQLVQGLADVLVLTQGCIDAMGETRDPKLEKVMDEKLIMVEEKASSMGSIINTLTKHPTRLLSALN